MKKNRHENLKSAVSSYLKRRNYTTSEVTFRRSEFSRGISVRELVQDEELQSTLAQENVICFNSVGPELNALDAQLSRLKSWLGGLPAQTSQELGQLVPLVLSHMYVEAVASGASRIGAIKFLKRHHAPSVQPDELLDELVTAGTCPDVLSRPNVMRFRSGRVPVTVSKLSLTLLQRFLTNSEVALLLQVLGQWVQFVSPGAGAHEEVEEVGSGGVLPPELMEVTVEPTDPSELAVGVEEAEVEALQAAIKAVNDGPQTPTPLRVFFIMNCENNSVPCASLGSKATLLGAGLETGAIEVWSLTQDCLASGLSTQRLLGHTAPVRALSWLGSKALISGSIDHDIRLWPSDTFNCAAKYRGHTGCVHALGVSPLNTYFASASADLSLKLWSPEFAFPLRTYCAHTQAPLTVDFHPNGHYLASGARDCTVRLWASSEGRLVRLFSGHRGGVRCVTFSPDGKSLASAGFESVVRIWDLAQGSCRTELTSSPLGTTQLAWSKDSASLAAAAPDGSVLVWDLTKESKTCMATYATDTQAILTFHFSAHNLTCVGTVP